MIQGRINKEMKEDLPVRPGLRKKAEDGKQSVAQYVAQVAKRTVLTSLLRAFVRFETGEGLEKKEEELCRGSCKAEEVFLQFEAPDYKPEELKHSSEI